MKKWTSRIAALTLGASVLFSAVGEASASTTYTVKSGDSLFKIGKAYNVSYQDIINVNNLSSTVIYPGQQLVIGNKENTTTHIVKSGESLFIIGKQYGVSYQTLMKWNQLSSTAVYPGQKLVVNGSSTKATSASTSGTTSSRGSKAVQIGQQYIGVPYVFGGSTPSGFDCSGFVTYVYNKAGISTSRLTAAGFYQKSTKISKPQVGDLVFFSNTYQAGVSHIGIYMGNNQMISASGKNVKVSDIFNSYWGAHFTGFGRLN